MLLFAIAVLPMAYTDAFNVFNEKPELWFMRGGAFITVFSLIADSVLLKTFEFLHPRGMGSLRLSELRDKYRYWLNFISRTSLMVTIVGSIIWGYGDIIYNQLH